MPDLKITLKERDYIRKAEVNPERRREYLGLFWKSRVEKKDPIARIGYSLWCKDARTLRRAISNGDRAYWNHRGYRYWNFMAMSTIINLAMGLERAGFQGTIGEKNKKIAEIGVEIAKQHMKSVNFDYAAKQGHFPGRLSLRQLAEYHHKVFEKQGIPRDYYGGTWLEIIPDEWEFELYGDWYCHDCDPLP